MAHTDSGVIPQTGRVLIRVRRPLSVLAWLAVPALFAAAAAVTLVLAPSVAWPATWLRRSLGLGYPALVFGAGILLNDVSLPATFAMIAGTPALITLVVLVARDRGKVVPIA